MITAFVSNDCAFEYFIITVSNINLELAGGNKRAL
jgi:hypothetical protein